MPIDYKKYPPNWKELRAQVLERAKNCCEECGAPNHELIYRPTPDTWKLMPEGHLADAMALDGTKFIKIVLTISHSDHDEHNHSVTIDRLKALCQRDHLRYDVKEKMRRRNAKKNKNQSKLDL